MLKYVIVAPFGFLLFLCRRNSPEMNLGFKNGSTVDVTALKKICGSTIFHCRRNSPENNLGFENSFTAGVTALKKIRDSKTVSL